MRQTGRQANLGNGWRTAVTAGFLALTAPALMFPLDRARDWIDQAIGGGSVGNQGNHPLAMRDGILAYAVTSDGLQWSDHPRFLMARLNPAFGACVTKEEAVASTGWASMGAAENADCLGNLTGIPADAIRAAEPRFKPKL